MTTDETLAAALRARAAVRQRQDAKTLAGYEQRVLGLWGDAPPWTQAVYMLLLAIDDLRDAVERIGERAGTKGEKE